MKLNHLSLSLISTACALALTACSSGGPVSVENKPTPTVKITTDSLKEKEQELNAKQAQLDKESQKLAEERKRLEYQRLEQSQLTEKEKSLKNQQIALNNEKDKLDKAREALNIQQKAIADLDRKQQELITKEKELNHQEQQLIASRQVLNEKSLALAKQQQAFDTMSKTQKDEFLAKEQRLATQKMEIDEQTQALAKEKEMFAQEKARFEAEKAKPDPVALNKAALLEGFVPNKIVEKTYKITTTNNLDETEETTYTHKFTQVSGKLLEAENNLLTNKPIMSGQSNLNELILDNKTIVLYSPEEIVAYKKTYPAHYEVKTISIDDQVVGKVGSLPKSNSRNDFAQMRYGYLQQNGKTTLFVQGHLTPESTETAEIHSPYNHFFYGHNNPRGEAGEILKPMPTSGVFDYTGFAFMGKDDHYTEYTANGIADFANKKIKIDVKKDNDVTLTLGGKISGNAFSGNYQGATIKGAFYGTEARDAGGMFYQTEGQFKDFYGVFGMTKANCGRTKCRELEDQSVLNDFLPQE